MLLTFLDKLGGLFDRRFIVAYWLPSFVFTVLLVAEAGLLYNAPAALKWWDALSATASVLLTVGLLFGVTILAYLLQPFTVPLMRLYLGYWPRRVSFLADWGKTRARREWSEAEISDKRLLPTRLGNTLSVAYEYPFKVYQLDPAIWLPRLTPLLPETFRAQMDNALVPVFSLLNLSALLLLFACIGGLAVALLSSRWWLFLLVWGGSLALSGVCYLASISQVRDYGTYIRVAFDLYRHELIKQMHIPLPDTPEKEWALWDRLHRWLHYTDELPRLPWQELAAGEQPLHYDNYHEPATESAEVAVTLLTIPALKLKLKLAQED
jgi:hypothetical protein